MVLIRLRQHLKTDFIPQLIFGIFTGYLLLEEFVQYFFVKPTYTSSSKSIVGKMNYLKSQALQPVLKIYKYIKKFHIHILFFAKAKAEESDFRTLLYLLIYTNGNPNTDSGGHKGP